MIGIKGQREIKTELDKSIQSIRTKKKLGDILIDAKVITQQDLDRALLEQKKVKGRKLGETLVDLGIIDELEIAIALKKQLNLDMTILSGVKISDKIINLIRDESILRKYVLIPFELKANNANILRVAMEDPLDMSAIDDIEILTGMQIEPVIATSREISSAIDKYYGSAEIRAVTAKYTKENEANQVEQSIDTTYSADVNSSPIVILVRTIIEQAVRQRASDIHIEPLESNIRVRYRVDGALFEAMSYQSEMLSAIIARIKVLGGMDITEKRKPLDGRITFLVDRQEYDIRVSSLPTVYGEKIVMRLASKKALSKPKSELGLSPQELAKFDALLEHPHGMLLVTGPTGSGKSTTLYTALSEINRESVNIVTVEDPVEANIKGINQVQVNPKAEMTFANALRSILRQDPDIIMIGEIRDSETAEIAVKASITGHLVVSTLHTNSASSTITRLIDMGIEPYLIADATVGVIAQRLVRRLCTCKIKKMATQAEKKLLGVAPDIELEIYEPGRCGVCNETGYYGRIGVYEIMPISNRLREVISRRGTADEIRRISLQEGMTTLSMNASKYVISGMTSMEELKHITYEVED